MLGQVASHVRAIRNVGSTVLHIAWVAAGRLDAMYQTTTKWWDVAAAGLIVEEAGGVLSDLSGGPMRPESIVASTPGIHEELLKILL
ncbi:inositol monophosphatase family protein [Ferrimicrobium acidiphilum]|nr:inositol monophosphatase family protein [Ferrimicrobium acidiphilum]